MVGIAERFTNRCTARIVAVVKLMPRARRPCPRRQLAIGVCCNRFTVPGSGRVYSNPCSHDDEAYGDTRFQNMEDALVGTCRAHPPFLV